VETRGVARCLPSEVPYHPTLRARAPAYGLVDEQVEAHLRRQELADLISTAAPVDEPTARQLTEQLVDPLGRRAEDGVGGPTPNLARRPRVRPPRPADGRPEQRADGPPPVALR
jgi:hypothetical protein